jgi:hypothetical protein
VGTFCLASQKLNSMARIMEPMIVHRRRRMISQ